MLYALTNVAGQIQDDKPEITSLEIWQFIIGGILLALSVILIVLILQQTGKEKGLSGAISGGSTETYFGKSKGASKDKILKVATIVLTCVVVALTLTLTILTTIAG